MIKKVRFLYKCTFKYDEHKAIPGSLRAETIEIDNIRHGPSIDRSEGFRIVETILDWIYNEFYKTDQYPSDLQIVCIQYDPTWDYINYQQWDKKLDVELTSIANKKIQLINNKNQNFKIMERFKSNLEKSSLLFSNLTILSEAANLLALQSKNEKAHTSIIKLIEVCVNTINSDFVEESDPNQIKLDLGEQKSAGQPKDGQKVENTTKEVEKVAEIAPLESIQQEAPAKTESTKEVEPASVMDTVYTYIKSKLSAVKTRLDNKETNEVRLMLKSGFPKGHVFQIEDKKEGNLDRVIGLLVDSTKRQIKEELLNSVSDGPTDDEPITDAEIIEEVIDTDKEIIVAEAEEKALEEIKAEETAAVNTEKTEEELLEIAIAEEAALEAIRNILNEKEVPAATHMGPIEKKTPIVANIPTEDVQFIPKQNYIDAKSWDELNELILQERMVTFKGQDSVKVGEVIHSFETTIIANLKAARAEDTIWKASTNNMKASVIRWDETFSKIMGTTEAPSDRTVTNKYLFEYIQRLLKTEMFTSSKLAKAV